MTIFGLHIVRISLFTSVSCFPSRCYFQLVAEILVLAFYKYSVISMFLVFKLVCPQIHLSINRMILNRIIVNLTKLYS